MSEDIFRPNPPEIKCNNSSDLLRFARHRTLGLYRNPSSRQPSIVGHLNKTCNFIRERNYKFKDVRSYEPKGRMMAVDISGRNVLVGGSIKTAEPSDCSVQSTILGTRNNKYDEIYMKDDYLLKLQWIPNGNQQFMVHTKRAIRIFDASRHTVVYDFERPDLFSADWHPSDTNLIALIDYNGVELLDLREHPSNKSSGSREADRYGTTCCWSTANSNHLMHSRLGNSVHRYDIRNKSKKRIGDFGMGDAIGSIKMSPRGLFLVTWSMKEHKVDVCYCDETQSWASARPLYRRSLPYYEQNEDYNCDFYQFHVTDTHLFMPLKSETLLPDDNSFALTVIDLCTGEDCNQIEAVYEGYDPIWEEDIYGRIDAVTAPANHWDTERIYTLNHLCQVGIWTLSGGSQKDVSARSMELTKANEKEI